MFLLFREGLPILGKSFLKFPLKVYILGKSNKTDSHDYLSQEVRINQSAQKEGCLLSSQTASVILRVITARGKQPHPVSYLPISIFQSRCVRELAEEHRALTEMGMREQPESMLLARRGWLMSPKVSRDTGIKMPLSSTTQHHL